VAILSLLSLAALDVNISPQKPALLVNHSQRKTGVRPGDIGKTMDFVRTARDRGHDIASFAAG